MLFFNYGHAQNLQVKNTDSLQFYLDRIDSLVHNDLPSALKTLKKSKRWAKRQGAPNNMAHLNLKSGFIFYMKGDYPKALGYYTKALEYYQGQDDEALQTARCYNGLGLIQQGIDRNHEALRLFNRAIQASTEITAKDKLRLLSSLYLNSAISQIAIGNYTKAKEDLVSALEKAKISNHKSTEQIALNRMAQLHYINKDYKKAVKGYGKVLNFPGGTNNWEKSFAYNGLAKCFLKQHKLALAEKKAKAAYGFALANHAKWDLVQNTKTLSDIYLAQNNPTGAYQYLELHQKYKDSIYNENYVRQIAMTQLQQQESENKRLLAEKEVSRKELLITKIIVASTALIAIILVVIIFQYRKNSLQKAILNKKLKQKNNEIETASNIITERNRKLQKANQDKAKLFSVLSHDLRSPVDSMKQVLEMLKSNDFSNEEKEDLIDEMHLQMSTTSLMLHNLLDWAKAQMNKTQVEKENVNLAQVVKDVLESNLLRIKQKSIKIDHQKDEKELFINVDKAHLGIILHNLFSNAIKYTPEAKHIKITYTNIEGICLNIFNQGVPISVEKIRMISDNDSKMVSEMGTDKERGTGLGLLLVKEYLALNGGNLKIDAIPEKGTVFSVCFPRENESPAI